jgi:hypothetical protein
MRKSSFNLWPAYAILILFGTLFFPQRGFPAEPRFRSLRRETNGWWRVHGDAPYQSVLTLEASLNLNADRRAAPAHNRFRHQLVTVHLLGSGIHQHFPTFLSIQNSRAPADQRLEESSLSPI